MRQKPKGSDATVKEHLERVAAITGKPVRELQALPEMPQEYAYLWSWHCSIGTEVAFGELDAWARLHGVKLKAHEIRLLRYMASKQIEQIRGGRA